MEIFILSLIFFGLAALGMAVGVLLRGSELKGTCATLGEGVHALIACEICRAQSSHGTGEPQSCPRRSLLGRSVEVSETPARRL